MEESWEEKTERLEREYQARIDRLREELIEIVEHEARGGIDGFRNRVPLGHIESTLTAAAESLTQLESTNAALTKRVAELEVDVLKSDADAVMWRERALNTSNKHAALIELKSANDERLCKEVALLRQQVGDLQSQLAWTTVSAGLPTEPGVYEFYDVKGRYMLGIYELTPGFRWLSFDGDTWAVVESEDYTKKIYTNYRRIELPKDGES